MNFGKAAEADWSEALDAYAKRHNLTRSAAAVEFATTAEANAIYKRITRTPRSEAISKAAAVGNVSAEQLAKSAFPDLSTADAMVSWLGTDAGRKFYNESMNAKAAAEQGA
ncbi:hypothetical protein [Bradyrhizobium sp. USDA 4473]